MWKFKFHWNFFGKHLNFYSIFKKILWALYQRGFSYLILIHNIYNKYKIYNFFELGTQCIKECYCKRVHNISVNKKEFQYIIENVYKESVNVVEC